mgnify:CR=1 FL=1
MPSPAELSGQLKLTWAVDAPVGMASAAELQMPGTLNVTVPPVRATVPSALVTVAVSVASVASAKTEIGVAAVGGIDRVVAWCGRAG